MPSPIRLPRDLTDDERLRLIVQAFLDCRQIPTVRLIARQFRRETGRVADAEEIEHAIARQSRD